MAKIINCENLTKTYGKAEVLKGVYLDFEEGDFVGILGPSGSGKSTLMYLLSGLEKPSDGKVFFKGQDINELNDDEMSKIRKKEFGFIFQFYNLIPNLTVKENIAFPMILNKYKKEDIITKVDELLDLVDLKEQKKKYVFNLSGGEQQRVAIARSLAASPSVIFADEPTGNLDSNNGEIIMNTLKQINEKYKTTILMVTHNESLLSYFNKVIRIKDGHLE